MPGVTFRKVLTVTLCFHGKHYSFTAKSFHRTSLKVILNLDAKNIFFYFMAFHDFFKEIPLFLLMGCFTSVLQSILRITCRPILANIKMIANDF